jgi:CHAT domain-containing protein
MPRRGVRWLAVVGLAASLGCARPDAVVPAFPLVSSVLEALGSSRPFTMRLSDGEPHATCVAPDTLAPFPTPTCAPLPDDVLQRLGALATAVSQAMRATPSADAQWAAALLDLVATPVNARGLDRVIGRLREVQARHPERALVLNHLAIARMLRARERADARDLFAALDLVEKAGAHDSASPAIRYNRALLHGTLGTPRRARESWAQVQEVERAAPWRAEAERQLAMLPAGQAQPFGGATPQAIATDPQGAREFALDSLLVRWARAALAADGAAEERWLEQLRMVAEGLLAAAGDSSLPHVVREVAESRPAAAVHTMLLAIQAYRRTQFDSTLALLDESLPKLRRAGATTTADWGGLMQSGAQLAQRRYGDAVATLDAIAARAQGRRDRALRARALWASAVAVGRDGRMDEAERRFGEARTLFVGLGEWQNAAFMATARADAQFFLGRSFEATNSAFLGLTELLRRGGLTRHEDLLLIADQLAQAGRPHAAAHLLSEAVLLSAASPRTKDLPETLARLAVVQREQGDEAAAAASVSRARPLVARVTDSAMRSRLEAELARAESRLVAERAPARALALVDAARQHFLSIPLDDARLLGARARLQLALGDSAAAERDLATSVQLTRSLADSASPAQARQLEALLLEGRRTLIEVALARGDTGAAYAESVELTSLEGRGAGVAQRAAAPGEAGAAELRFVVSREFVLSWATSAHGRSLVRVPVARDSLAAVVSRLVNLTRLGDDSATLQTVGQSLYQSLIAPHVATLDGASRLDVHMDDVLHDLPLAVLADAEGRALGVRFAIRHRVPAGVRRAGAAKIAGRGALLVGNPAWRRAEHPELEPLRMAAGEVERVAALYPGAMVLTGSAATKAALLDAMPRHEVLHFAGHSRVVVERPETSHLVLAGGATYSDGVLTAAEIARLDLRGVRLVVLSSCGRSRDDATSLGTVNALAVAFLDAGVEEVVASGWEVSDEVSASLATKLHERHRGARAEVRTTYDAAGDALQSSGYITYSR